jgi:hypothetical protein
MPILHVNSECKLAASITSSGRSGSSSSRMMPSVLKQKLSPPFLENTGQGIFHQESNESVHVPLIGIASPSVIFLPLPLFLLLLSLQVEEELVIHILFIVLFIVKFESGLITDPNFLRDSYLNGLSAVAHLHQIIA